jgi:hypothetical protein
MDGYGRDAITMFIVPLCLGIVGALICFYFWKLSVGLIAGMYHMYMRIINIDCINHPFYLSFKLRGIH